MYHWNNPEPFYSCLRKLYRNRLYPISQIMPKFSCAYFCAAFNTYQTMNFKMIEIQIRILDGHIKTDSVLYL